MSLKKLSVVADAPTAKSKTGVPIVRIEGKNVADYVTLKGQKADIEARLVEVEAEVKRLGVDEIIRLNLANPTSPTTSVKIFDEVGGKAMIQLKDAYPPINAEAATDFFERRGIDVNSVAQFTVKAAFDNKIFYAPDGTFLEEVYDTYRAVIEEATRALVATGNLPATAKSPLTGAQVAAMKPGFHERRWTLISTLTGQRELHETVPATVAAKPLAD